MQQGSFLWRWKENAPLLYCWATDIGQWKYRAPNVLDVVIKIKGYFEYQNLGAEVPGGSFAGVPGGGTVPGTGGRGDFAGPAAGVGLLGDDSASMRSRPAAPMRNSKTRAASCGTFTATSRARTAFGRHRRCGHPPCRRF